MVVVQFDIKIVQTKDMFILRDISDSSPAENMQIDHNRAIAAEIYSYLSAVAVVAAFAKYEQTLISPMTPEHQI